MVTLEYEIFVEDMSLLLLAPHVHHSLRQVELDVSVRRVGSEESVNVRGAGAVIDILGLLPGTKYAIR
jgi:hypothetical protein